MAKIISVSDDVYQSLKSLKGEESYSSLIRRLLKNMSNKEKILGFFGKGGVNATKVEELKTGWKRWSEKYA